MSGRRSDSPIFVIDQIVTKWARGNRETAQMHPLERLRLKRLGQLIISTGGDVSDQEMAFDKCYCEADAQVRAVIFECYCTGKPIEQIARSLGVDRKRVYEQLDNTLFYFKGALRSKGYRI